MIDRIRENDLHAVLLWFGTWKNGQMEYTPAWVKTDRKRFRRALCADGGQTTVLSPFCRENKEQDKRAFCKLVEFVKEYDESTGTVRSAWEKNGEKQSGSWEGVFGGFGAEPYQKRFRHGLPHAAIWMPSPRIFMR